MSENKVQLNGIFKQGYGISPKLVMRDKNLSIEAKAIYAYISSYCGDGTTAFPSVDLVCHELGISRQRFNKHRKQLEVHGYISVEQVTDNGKFKSNLYTINVIPTYQNVTSGNATTENPTSGNITTNNNNSINNSFNNNNLNQRAPKSGGEAAAIPAKAIHDLYNEICTRLPTSRGLSPKRRDQIQARWKEEAERQSLDWWRAFFEYVNQSDFLANGLGSWKGANLEWITNANNMVKIIEGQYENE